MSLAVVCLAAVPQFQPSLVRHTYSNEHETKTTEQGEAETGFGNPE